MEFTILEVDPNTCILTSTPSDSHASNPQTIASGREMLGDESAMRVREKGELSSSHLAFQGAPILLLTA